LKPHPVNLLHYIAQIATPLREGNLMKRAFANFPLVEGWFLRNEMEQKAECGF